MKPFANTVLAVTALALPAVPMLADEPGDLDTLKARVDKIEADAAAKPDSGKWYDAIEFAFGATGIVQGSSNAGSLSEDGDSSAASGSIDLELTAPATEGGFLSLHMESGSGAGLDGKIGTLSGLNDDADDDSNLRLTEAWFEQSFADVFRFRIGKIDLTTDFDTNAVANDETAQFLSSGFVNGLATEFPDDNGFGAMLWYSPSELIDIGIGYGDADADFDDVFSAGFSIAEVDFKPVFGGLQGNYRIYGWYNGKDHESLKDGSLDNANSGLGLSFDQQVGAGVTLFARYGLQKEELSQVKSSWSAGFSLSGELFGREDDVLGLAYGRAVIGGDWKAQDVINGIDSADEGHIELFYNLAVNEHVTVTPDFQWVASAGGDGDADDFFVFGLRTQFTF